tara:strand:+ start:119 stop:478 length:360 start_codon:yes stop_codon:yes gene_type:complete
MKPEVRITAAAIGAAILTKRKVTSVYSDASGGHYNIDAELIGSTVKAYDYSRNCDVSGDLPSSVYDYGTNTHLEFKSSDNKIDGYDYGSSSHFEVTINGNDVEVYDYSDGGYHNYSVTE